MAVSNEEERLVRVHDVIQQLPPPHYRCQGGEGLG